MKKKNKKKWLSTFVGGLLGFAVGAAGGLLMVKIADKTDSIRNGGMWTFVLNILIVLGAIYASMFLHILVHPCLIFSICSGLISYFIIREYSIFQIIHQENAAPENMFSSTAFL